MIASHEHQRRPVLHRTHDRTTAVSPNRLARPGTLAGAPLLLGYRGPVSPPVFVSYRRADEPFAAALVFALLADRWEGDSVFLDTRFLRQRGDVGRHLLDAVANSELVLAVMGRTWDDPVRRM